MAADVQRLVVEVQNEYLRVHGKSRFVSVAHANESPPVTRTPAGESALLQSAAMYYVDARANPEFQRVCRAIPAVRSSIHGLSRQRALANRP